MEPVLSGKIEELKFVSEFDRSIQECLIMKSRSIPASGIVIYLHGATNHKEQGFNREIFNGTFGRLQDFLHDKNFVYVCPEYRGDSWMNHAAECDIKQLTGMLKREFRTEKMFIMGGSMGGTSALIFTTRNPDLVSGVLALCPATDMKKLYYQWVGTERDFLAKTIEVAYGGSPEKNPEEYIKRSAIHQIEKFRSIPTAIVHGDADMLISVEHSRLLINKALVRGIKLLYHEIKAGDHDSPIRDFEIVEKALLWLFSKGQ
ncbi:MAG: S9 family peptidase [Candidatus Omnitrophica bacterium]|nr:S9 family peptidase [Candidatus Omnitrophota bacterium]